MSESNRRTANSIVISLEAQFHGVQDPSWTSKLIQYPKGGLLWGLHLSKQKNADGIDLKVIGCLLCFGPIKEHNSEWSMTFDHVFTLACKRYGSAGPARQSNRFSQTDHIISNYEWGVNKTSLPENWGYHDNVKLSCHMYISYTSGLDGNVLREAALLDENKLTTGGALSPMQVENQVIKCFSDLLADEEIVYSDDGLEAIGKLSQFFSFPNVLDACRRYLMRIQSGAMVVTSMENSSTMTFDFDLESFDYHGNTSSRRQRMAKLTENDIILIFQDLCSLAFRKK